MYIITHISNYYEFQILLAADHIHLGRIQTWLLFSWSFGVNDRL